MEAGETSRELFVFVLPARLEYRDAATAFLTHLCRQLEAREALTTAARHGVISSFVEAFNNSVLHAYAGSSTDPVEIEFMVAEGLLRLTVSDRGRPFDFKAVPQPDLDALPEGGLGLFIIHQFMDEVQYVREGAKNVLCMEKRMLAFSAPLQKLHPV